MSRQQFLQNVRTARNLLAHQRRSRPPIPAWLTPSSVSGFDVRDFPEFTAEMRAQLKDNVERFTRAAKLPPNSRAASAEQTHEAKDALLNTVAILQPYLQAGPADEKIGQVLANIDLPESVVSWEYELEEDSTGEEAIWIWIIVEDSAAKDDPFLQVAADIDEKVRQALKAAGIEKWAYVNFRTATEQREV